MITETSLTSTISVTHHGAKHGVTGSCHQLFLDEGSLLIDCGQFQGRETRSLDIDFDMSDVKALIVTHAHIDHTGRIPWLLAAGFDGPIYVTPATKHLLPLMIDDALNIQGLNSAKRQTYISALNHQMKECDYQQWLPIQCGKTPVKLRFQPAGHILGSAYIELSIDDSERIVFSGDLGPSHTPLLPDPLPPQRADFLFLESTYGNREHQNIEQRHARLLSIINRALDNGGVIVIPAFSVGRTQELLYDMEQLVHSHALSKNLPIIIDSPMANKITHAYRQFKQLWATEAKHTLSTGRHPLAFDQCITIDSHQEHIRLVNRLASTEQAAIVVAASGMCTGGRVVNYLKSLLPLTSTDVIFCGYQARGTLGSALSQQPKSVSIDGDPIEVNATAHTISGYSAHADKADLTKFVEGIGSCIQQVHLIHGEGPAKSALKADLMHLKNVKKVIE